MTRSAIKGVNSLNAPSYFGGSPGVDDLSTEAIIQRIKEQEEARRLRNTPEAREAARKARAEEKARKKLEAEKRNLLL